MAVEDLLHWEGNKPTCLSTIFDFVLVVSKGCKPGSIAPWAATNQQGKKSGAVQIQPIEYSKPLLPYYTRF